MNTVAISLQSVLGGDTRVVPWSGILVIGLDAVIIEAEANIVKASQVPEVKEVLDRGFVLQGIRVATTEGRELGTIENFFFEQSTGALVGYELVGGENQQQPSGRAFMPAHATFEAGKDYAFVDPSITEKIEDRGEALRSRRE